MAVPILLTSYNERLQRLWIARSVHSALNLAQEARRNDDLPRARRWLVAVRALRIARDI